MIRLSFFCLLMAFLGGCATAPDLEGLWCNANYYTIENGDTTYSYLPELMHFGDQQMFNWVRFDSPEGTVIDKSIITAKWQLKDDAFIIIQSEKSDTFKILLISENLLTVQHHREDGIRTYKRMPSAYATSPSLLGDRLKNGIWAARASTLLKVDDKAARTEFHKKRYLFPDIPKSLEQPTHWSTEAYGTHTFLVMQGLTANPKEWITVCVDTVSSALIGGTYSFRNRTFRLSLSAQNPKISRDAYLNFYQQLVGTWVVIPQQNVLPPPTPPVDTTGVYTKETFIFKESGACEWNYYQHRYKGTWQLSKLGQVILMDFGDRTHYFRIGEFSNTSELMGICENLSSSDGLVPTKIIKQHN